MSSAFVSNKNSFLITAANEIKRLFISWRENHMIFTRAGNFPCYWLPKPITQKLSHVIRPALSESQINRNRMV